MNNFHQKVYLIRHGETEWTRLQKHTGRTDISLTDAGRTQASWLKERLSTHSFAKVYCSPLKRAKETCEIANFLSRAELDPDLKEWNYGDYEGKTILEIHSLDPHWTIFTKGGPHGESVADIKARTLRVIAKVKAVPGDVALFSSGHFLRSLAASWIGKPIEEGAHFLLSTGSISILGYERETPVLIKWNQTQP